MENQNGKLVGLDYCCLSGHHIIIGMFGVGERGRGGGQGERERGEKGMGGEGRG